MEPPTKEPSLEVDNGRAELGLRRVAALVVVNLYVAARIVVIVAGRDLVCGPDWAATVEALREVVAPELGGVACGQACNVQFADVRML